MIVAHNTGNGAWTPQTPDGIQAGPTFKRSGEDCRCFVIVAIRIPIVSTAIRRALSPLRLCGSVTAEVHGCPRGVAPLRPSRALRDHPVARPGGQQPYRLTM